MPSASLRFLGLRLDAIRQLEGWDMDEAKILELALSAGFETDCKTFAAWDGADCTDKLFAFARLVAEAEREACAVLADDMVLYTGLDVAEAIRSRTERS